MYIGEVVNEKNNLKFVINQTIELFFKVAKVDSDKANEIIKKLFDLIDKYRSHLILLNKVNNEKEVSIGGSAITLANAVIFKDILELKIDILNRLISADSSYTDFKSLIENRDKFYSEYKTLNTELKLFEWRSEID